MTSSTLKIESLEPRTLLAALLDAESDTANPATDDNGAFDMQDALVSDDHESSNDKDKKHHKHGIKHKLSSAAHKMKDGFEHATDKVKHKLDKGLEKTGEAIRSSKTATAITDEAIEIAAKVLVKIF